MGTCEQIGQLQHSFLSYDLRAWFSGLVLSFGMYSTLFSIELTSSKLGFAGGDDDDSASLPYMSLLALRSSHP